MTRKVAGEESDLRGAGVDLAQSSAPPVEADSAQLLDERSITQVMLRIARAQDERDWKTYASCFAERVLVEQPMDPSWTPREVPRDEWARRAAATLDGFDLTHHCLVNFRIGCEGDTAMAEVDLVARHEIRAAAESCVYTLGGRYHIRLRRVKGEWRITNRRLEVLWEDGDRQLTDLARLRVSQRP